jgi:membrane protein required for colicin V production
LACLVIIPNIITVEDQDWWTQSQLVPKFLMLEDWAIQTFGDMSHWRPKDLVKAVG